MFFTRQRRSIPIKILLEDKTRAENGLEFLNTTTTVVIVNVNWMRVASERPCTFH